MKATHSLWTAVILAMSFFAANLVAGSAELNPVEQYKDVRGAIVFRTYCVLCHGTKANGEGRAAKLYSPRPANLVTSTASDEYKEQIIRNGGASVGRSPFMPPWGRELTEEQIRDVVYFLSVINVNNNKAHEAVLKPAAKK